MIDEAEKFYLTMKAKRDATLQERFPDFEIGEGSYGGLEVRRWAETPKLIVGKYCSFSFGVEVFLGGGHRTEWVTTFPFSALPGWPEAHGIKGHPVDRGDTIIGNDVWIGAGAVIMSGVHIGDGAVVGSRAVVNHDVAPYSIVAGVPAKHLHWRFDEATRLELLHIKWWDWPRERIVKALPYMLNPDIITFINEVEKGNL